MWPGVVPSTVVPPAPRWPPHTPIPPPPPPPSPRRFLEEELARRYREAAPHTLAVLQERVEAATRELVKAEAELRAAEDVGAVRAAGGAGMGQRVGRGARWLAGGCLGMGMGGEAGVGEGGGWRSGLWHNPLDP